MSAVSFDPGWLRHRVVIEAPVATPDGAGGETLTWQIVATAWAQIEPTAAREEIRADRATGVVTHAVTLRYREDIAGGMRVLYRGRRYRVLTAHDPDARRRYIALKTEIETP